MMEAKAGIISFMYRVKELQFNYTSLKMSEASRCEFLTFCNSQMEFPELTSDEMFCIISYKVSLVIHHYLWNANACIHTVY